MQFSTVKGDVEAAHRFQCFSTVFQIPDTAVIIGHQFKILCGNFQVIPLLWLQKHRVHNVVGVVGNSRSGAPVKASMSDSASCNQGGTVEYFVSHP